MRGKEGFILSRSTSQVEISGKTALPDEPALVSSTGQIGKKRKSSGKQILTDVLAKTSAKIAG